MLRDLWCTQPEKSCKWLFSHTYRKWLPKKETSTVNTDCALINFVMLIWKPVCTHQKSVHCGTFWVASSNINNNWKGQKDLQNKMNELSRISQSVTFKDSFWFQEFTWVPWGISAFVQEKAIMYIVYVANIKKGCGLKHPMIKIETVDYNHNRMRIDQRD